MATNTSIGPVSLEVLDKMIELIPGKWIGHSANLDESAAGQGCILNQFAHARRALHVEKDHTSSLWMNTLKQVISDLYPDRINNEASPNIIHFNDHPNTTEEDVLLVLKHTRERLT